MKEQIRKKLLTLQDLKYKEFHSSICPNTDNIIGIRIPVLRAYTKKLLQQYNGKDLLKQIGDKYYEEIMLQGMLIGLEKDNNIQNILNDIKKYKVVLGVHDVRCHMYGPTKSFMTLHVEVDSSKDLLLIHDEIDNIEREIGNKYQLELTIHMDPIDINDSYSLELKAKLTILMDELNLHFHDFRIVKGDSHTNVLFDVVVPFKYKLTEEEIKTKVEEYFKDNKQKLYFIINFDGEYID